MNWFKGRRGSNESDIPDLPASVEYNGDHHMSYNVTIEEKRSPDRFETNTHSF